MNIKVNLKTNSQYTDELENIFYLPVRIAFINFMSGHVFLLSKIERKTKNPTLFFTLSRRGKGASISVILLSMQAYYYYFSVKSFTGISLRNMIILSAAEWFVKDLCCG